MRSAAAIRFTPLPTPLEFQRPLPSREMATWCHSPAFSAAAVAKSLKCRSRFFSSAWTPSPGANSSRSLSVPALSAGRAARADQPASLDQNNNPYEEIPVDHGGSLRGILALRQAPARFARVRHTDPSRASHEDERDKLRHVMLSGRRERQHVGLLCSWPKRQSCAVPTPLPRSFRPHGRGRAPAT